MTSTCTMVLQIWTMIGKLGIYCSRLCRNDCGLEYDADTFVLIQEIDLLPQLFRQVLVPPAVFAELSDPGTPSQVRTWLASLLHGWGCMSWRPTPIQTWITS